MIAASCEIRPESPADAAHIRNIIEAAFAGKPYADGDEQDLVDMLREVGALTLSLVAEVDGEIVGHIAFSPASPSTAGQSWFALGPVAVQPELQGTGIGTLLIERGLDLLTERKADGCILTGDPAYYQRFGFSLSPQHTPKREPEDYFMLKRLGASDLPEGPIHFHDAFYSV